MAARGVLQHDSSNGTPWDKRIRRYHTISWKASPPHDENMLHGGFRAYGVARVVDKDGTAWWTTDFGGK